MKQKPLTNSTQRQISDQPWVNCPDGFASSHQQVMLSGFRRVGADGYPRYIDPENDPYTYLVAPNPPTPEAIKRAQPYRADIIQMDAIIKHPTQQFDG